MCTAITLRTNDTYFGRNLDFDFSYNEEIVVTPRNYKFQLRNGAEFHTTYAINGIAYVIGDYPLYYDAFNEKGLGIGGLMFAGNAHYNDPADGEDNITQFELIPWILGQCASVAEARTLLEKINITNIAFSPELPTSDLHWILSDATESIVVESMRDGLHIYDNPTGVLTNNPPFNEQLFRLNDYAAVSPRSVGNHFSDKLNLSEYSRGMGAIGLPGDFSSQSRFVRATFATLNSVCDTDEMSSVTQFLHLIDTAAQPRGVCDLGDGKYEITIYSSCCNLQKGIYYYTTYGNRQINAVDMYKTNLDGAELARFPVIMTQNVNYLN